MTTSNEEIQMENTINYVEGLFGNDYQKLSLAISDAMDWAHCNGLVLRTKEYKDRSDICQIAPFALLPSPFPRCLFDQAMSVQKELNLLYLKVSWDYAFLKECHQEVVKSDEFTRRLMSILETVHNEGVKQKITLLTQRADYMCHVDNDTVATEKRNKFLLKQIEVNNIAVSMGGLAQRVTAFHKRAMGKYGLNISSSDHMPNENESIETLCGAIYFAWELFADKSAITLIVVGETNQNQFDQRYIEYELERLSKGKMLILRLTLAECAERLQLEEKTSRLFLCDKQRHLKSSPSSGDLLVGIIYFRTGYTPEDYGTEQAWQARLTMERSTAIKCPWIGLQLANTKKIQQVLSCHNVLEKYYAHSKQNAAKSEELENVRATFASMWGLEHDDEETRSVIQDAIANPHRYVLKPQLEGGGGNYFGSEIAEKLVKFTHEMRASHILMQRIQPLVVKNYLVRPFDNEPTKLQNVVSELGIYGSLVGIGGDEEVSVLWNRVGGHILRTKLEHVNEGGVAVGASVVDTPYLF